MIGKQGYVYIPMNYPIGTVFDLLFTTPDGTTRTYKGTIRQINVSNLTPRYLKSPDVITSYSEDSKERVILDSDESQLEEGCYTYLTVLYKGRRVEDYGATVTTTFKTGTNSESYATLDGQTHKLEIKRDAKGGAAVQIDFKIYDGGQLIASFTRKITVYNAPNDARVYTDAKHSTNVTKQISTQLYVLGNDSLASSSTGTVKFVPVLKSAGTGYTLTESGLLTLYNKSANFKNHNIYFTVDQVYNGRTIRVVENSPKPVYIEYGITKTYQFYDDTANQRITDDKETWSTLRDVGMDFVTLNSLGYTKINFSIRIYMKEYDDGYQEIYLITDKNGTPAFDKETKNSAQYKNTKHEYVPGKKGKDMGYGGTTGSLATTTFVKANNTNANVAIGFGANGDFNDDWLRSTTTITFTAE